MKARTKYSIDYEDGIEYLIHEANNHSEIKKFVGDKLVIDRKLNTITVITTIRTPTASDPDKVREKFVKVEIGEYIIKDLDGYFSVLTQDEFELLYDID